MKVAITLNDVLRVHQKRVEQILSKKFVDIFEDETLANIAPKIISDDGKTLAPYSPEKERTLVSEHIDTLRFSKDFDFESQRDFEDTLHNDYGFEIYGAVPTLYNECSIDFNKLYHAIAKEHSCTVLSQQIGNSKPATLHFLAANKILANNIKFIADYTKVWQLYDVVITADPFILKKKNLKNNKKLSIKINTEYNTDIEADHDFNNIREVLQMF